MTLIVHPFTADANNEPAYTADNFRHTNTVWLSPADTSVGSASTCIQGVRYEGDTPICTISGLRVSVKAHSGILYPFAGQSPYTYYTTGESVSIPNVTQSWKIAIVVTDPGVGIGDKPGATLKAISSTTPDSNINGLVLALVTQGVVNEVAPRLMNGSVIQVNTYDQLLNIKTANGQKAIVKTTGQVYTARNGGWVTPTGEIRRTVFKPQDAHSFQMNYTPTIDVDNVRRLLFVNLSSFHSAVSVKNFPIYFYVSGPKPSQDIDLGTVGFVLNTGAPYIKTFRWNSSDGNIVLTNDLGTNDNVIMQSLVIPIPENVQFS